MKKILYLILGVLLFIPFLVKADMGAPMIKGFKATPKDPSGADIYRYDEDKDDYVKTGRKLEYGTIIELEDYDGSLEEEDGDSDFFVPVDYNDEDNEDEVKFSDLMLAEKEYKVNKNELGKVIKAVAIVKQEIKKGPGPVYEGTGKYIPEGAKIQIQEFYDQSPWVYVEYNGVKGFITIYEGKVGMDGVYTTIISPSDIEITKPGTTKKIGTIKANTKTNVTVYRLDAWSGDNYYIEYGNVRGIAWVIYKTKPAKFKPTEAIKLYEKLVYNEDGELTSKAIYTIPKGKSFSSEYYKYDYDIKAYCEIDGVKGWIYVYGRSTDDGDKDDKSVDEILGIKESDLFNSDILKSEKEETDNNTEPSPVEILPETDTTLTDENNNNTDVQKTAKKVPILVYYCLGAAVVIALTAAVTVSLINNKNKNRFETYNPEANQTVGTTNNVSPGATTSNVQEGKTEILDPFDLKK